MTGNYKYSVAIQCMTYNHSKYITDALNSFVMQETDFPYVILLVDDASTDDEERIILDYVDANFNLSDTSIAYTKETEYANITYAQHKIKSNCFIVSMCLKYNHYQIGKKYEKLNYLSEWLDKCKYIALCEGDDYWIDPLKLQKQVDILEKDSQCSLVISNGYITNNQTNNLTKINPLGNKKSGYINTDNVFREQRLIPTASMIYRSNLFPMPDFFNKAPVGDKPIRMWCAIKGSVYYFKEPMTYYRTNSINSFSQTVCKNPNYAKYICDNFIIFLDEFNKYTNYKYTESIKYMKARELYLYYYRIGDAQAIENAEFLKYQPFTIKVRRKLSKTFIGTIYRFFKSKSLKK